MDAAVPGRTTTFGDPCADLDPVGTLDRLAPLKDRDVILLCTATITEENIYMNGLFQNVLVLYRMFESMGYAPIMIVSEKPKSLANIPGPLRSCRMLVVDDLFKQAMPNVVAMIEIGMSVDASVRQFIKMIGGKSIKLYLGNILNIDVETPIFLPWHHFAHHVVGRCDKILVSPHYGQHAEYAAYINHVYPARSAPLEDLIAPYVWDSSVITRDGTQALRWRPARQPEEEVFVVMEPNISFQKCSYVPLLSLEQWYRGQGGASGSWKGKVVVVNGERLSLVPHFTENVQSRLSLFRDGRVEMIDRKDIVSTMQEYPSATFVLHNYNNEYNYMTLELMWCGFPVLHNSPSWAEFGYYYRESEIVEAAEKLEDIRKRHATSLGTYAGHAQLLAWRHSPHNPSIQERWETLIRGK